MRTLLFENDDFSVFADLRPVVPPVGGYCLTLSSRRQAVRHPHEEQVRFQGFLDREGLQALAGLIDEALQS